MEKSDTKILIVDDNVDMLNFFKKALEKEGYSTILAEDGKKALDILKTHNGVDLILSDVKMPNKSGLDVLKEVREKYPDVKIILITGYAQVEEYLQAMEQGAYEYLTKPIRVNDLIDCVNRALA